MQDFIDCDATELARRVRTGEVSPAELVDRAIDAIEAVNPKLNAVVHRMYDKARARARGPLGDGPFAGVPMAVKDFDGFVKDEPYTASTRFLDGFVPDHDATAIARLREAGLIFLAKTNLSELAILGTTESEWRGPAHNPWNPAHTPGGSSGGSAALVAARAVPVAHGGDGGGSLRIPASACGLVGLKATRGRIPLAPDHGEGWGGYVQWGVLTRSVRDTAALLDVMAGPAPGDPYGVAPPARPYAEEVGADPGTLRVGLVTRSIFGRETAPDCRQAAERAAALLRELGHEVEEATLPVDRDRLALAYLVQVGVGVAAEIEEMGRWVGRRPTADMFEMGTWFLRQVGMSMTALDLQQARDAVQEAGRQMAEFHQRYDLFLGPTLAHPPVRLGQLALKPAERVGLAALRTMPLKPAIRQVLARLAANNFEYTPNTELFNQTGQPAISLPLHWSDAGLPIGVQLAAAMGREDLLIRVASQLEQAAPWIGRKPPVCAA
ncbi:MAG: amidase [Deltaproteobacteria bacterium]|nr:MAG: amidase [Deltaproteobacteria bacterium]